MRRDTFQLMGVLFFTTLFFSVTALSNTRRFDEGSQDVSAYDRAMELLYSGNAEQAMALLKNDLQKRGSQKTLYGIGWIEFYLGDYRNAEKTLEYILNESPTPQRGATCKRVLGLVYARTGRYEKGEKVLLEALEIFQSLNDTEEVIKVHVSLSELFLHAKDIERADHHFRAGFDLNKQAQLHQGFFFSLKARLEFMKSNYKGALQFAINSLQEYQDQGSDMTGIAGAWSDVAFYRILTGDITKGEQEYQTATQLLEEAGVKQYLIWNELSSVLLAQCKKQPFKAIADRIHAEALRTNDSELKNMLEFVLAYKCKHRHFDK